MAEKDYTGLWTFVQNTSFVNKCNLNKQTVKYQLRTNFFNKFVFICYTYLYNTNNEPWVRCLFFTQRYIPYNLNCS
jgi:protein involved in ribonucleotide reduction